MKPKTADHLATANENRDLARRMVRGMAKVTAAERWAVVIAFYAAVHYVNAYLWETGGIEPQDHADRRRRMQRDATLGQLVFRYRRLVMFAYQIRYTPSYRLTATNIRLSLQTMREIEAAITPLL